MLKTLLKLFRRARVHVPDTDRLAEGEARKVDVGDPAAGGLQVLLCRVEGRVYALHNHCPHEGGKIVAGPLVEGKYAVCPLHGYAFDPRTGKPVGVTCRSARTFRVVERDGSCEILL